jgi:hypothetical protein
MIQQVIRLSANRPEPKVEVQFALALKGRGFSRADKRRGLKGL